TGQVPPQLGLSRQSKQPAWPGIQSREDFIRLTNGNSSLKSVTLLMLLASGASGSSPARAIGASRDRANRAASRRDMAGLRDCPPIPAAHAVPATLRLCSGRGN